jgi:hypothetical protein
MSTLLAALPALVVLSAGGCQANKPVTMTLRSTADVGPEVTAAKGPNGEPALEIANRRFGPSMDAEFTFATIDDPAISSPDYVLRGRVKCDVVAAAPAGSVYLELLSDFGGQGAFFSRFSLASAATGEETAGMAFTDVWRDFELPFHAKPGMIPRRLTLNAFIPRGGMVTVAEPLMVTSLKFMTPWWTALQGIVIGVSLAACFGLLAGLIGLTIFSGKSSPLIASLCGAGLAIGGVALIVGLAALCAGQPLHVSCPLLILGGIGVSYMGLTLRKIVQRSQVDELRRMTAADVV